MKQTSRNSTHTRAHMDIMSVSVYTPLKWKNNNMKEKKPIS